MNLHLKLAEQELSSLLPTISGQRDSMGVVFNLSRLSINKEGSEHVSIALNILHDHLRSYNGDIFLFKNGDIVLNVASQNTKAVFESIYQLRYLFADDPLAYHKDGRENEDFCLTFFSHNWSVFIKHLSSKIANDDTPLPGIEYSDSLFEVLSFHVENSLSNVSWEKVIKTRPICLIAKGGKPKNVINHINIDLESLRHELRQSLDIVLNRNLFNFVREVIDLRLLIKLLSVMRENPQHPAKYVNLSTSTLESEEFAIFNDGISEHDRRNLIIGIHISDVFRELSDFMRLKDKLLSMGYKLCLHGLDVQSFLMMDRKALGFDLLKLKWQPDILKQDYHIFEADLRAKVQSTGVSRVIFADCDSNNALAIGQSFSISLFQGKLIDKICQ